MRIGGSRPDRWTWLTSWWTDCRIATSSGLSPSNSSGESIGSHLAELPSHSHELPSHCWGISPTHEHSPVISIYKPLFRLVSTKACRLPVSGSAVSRRVTNEEDVSMWRSVRKGAGVLLAVAVMGGITAPRAGSPQDPAFTADNKFGRAQTINVAGFPVVAEDNPFFTGLGINGRRCVTCHQPNQNMTVTPAGLRARFVATAGTDPIFRTNDGSNSPQADVSTVEARRAAYSMLLTKGLIRVGLPIPSTAEFDLVDVRDPYGYASAAELSLFRRPLPATNLAFLSTVMWDGRETLQKGSAAAITSTSRTSPTPPRRATPSAPLRSTMARAS